MNVSQVLKPVLMCLFLTALQPFLFHILNSTEESATSPALCAISADLQQEQAVLR